MYSQDSGWETVLGSSAPPPLLQDMSCMQPWSAVVCACYTNGSLPSTVQETMRLLNQLKPCVHNSTPPAFQGTQRPTETKLPTLSSVALPAQDPLAHIHTLCVNTHRSPALGLSDINKPSHTSHTVSHCTGYACLGYGALSECGAAEMPRWSHICQHTQACLCPGTRSGGRRVCAHPCCRCLLDCSNMHAAKQQAAASCTTMQSTQLQPASVP